MCNALQLSSLTIFHLLVVQQNFDVLFTAMRIHISETTHRELLKAGIYHMTKRGDINVKVFQFFIDQVN